MESMKVTGVDIMGIRRKMIYKYSLATLFLLMAGMGYCLPAQAMQQQSHSALFTQNIKKNEYHAGVLKKVISVDLNNAPFERGLRIIAKKAGLKLVFSEDIIPAQKSVSLHKKNIKLEDALWALLAGTDLRFGISSHDHLVVMKSSEKNEKGEKQIRQLEAVSGTVTDATSGEALPSVNISVKGTTTGTFTDNEGQYELGVPSLQDTLVFSFVGYQQEQVPIDGRTTVDVALKVQTLTGEEMVVVGYGTTSKEDLTGSVSTVGSETFEDMPISNPVAAMQGNLPGTLVQRTNGRPGNEGYSVNVRGFSSVNGTTDALVIIDGIPGDMSHLSPDAIKSVTVLKDAAASIYGARAAGGVVLVETKEGKAGAPQIGINMSYTYKRVGNFFKQLNTLQVAEMQMEAAKNAGQSTSWTDKLLEDVRKGDVHPIFDDNGEFTNQFTGNWDYPDLMLGSGGQQNYEVNISGGEEHSSYYADFGWIQEQGVFNYGDDDNQKLNALLNYKYNIGDDLQINTKLNISRQLRHEPNYPEQFRRIYTMFPFYRPTVWGDDTKWATAGGYDNPMQVYSEGGTNEYRDMRINANASVDYEIMNGLNLTAQVGTNHRFRDQEAFARYMQFYDPLTGGPFGEYNNPNEGSVRNEREQYYNVTSYMTYKNSFNDSNEIKVTAGGSYERNKFRFTSASRKDFPSNEFFSLNLGDGDSQTNDGGGSGWAIGSLFGRGTYSFNSKYILTGNFRYDGSSRFSSESRWGLFGGIMAAWRLSDESFIDNLGIFDNLKLRVSYGSTGNQGGIALYDYIQRIYIGGAYPFGNGSRASNASLGSLVDPTRTWETIVTKNIGLDFGVLGNRLSGTFDYFIKNNRDMLIPITLPSVLGATPPAGNNGELKSWGWEAKLNWQDKINRDWSFNIGFHMSDSENKVIDYGGQDTYDVGLVRVREGYPLNTYHGYISAGIIKTQQELDAYKSLDGVPGGIGIGDAMYKDINGDGQISVYDDKGNQGDVVPLGSSTPRYYFGTNVGLSYKGFQISALVQGVLKKQIQLSADWSMPWYYSWHKPEAKWYHNTWSPERPNNINPELTFADIRYWNYQTSDRTEIDASYIRLKNVRVAYNLPQSVLSYIGLQNAKVYITGFDIWEKQNFEGGTDVESLKAGQNNQRSYPFTRSYAFGINLTF